MKNLLLFFATLVLVSCSMDREEVPNRDNPPTNNEKVVYEDIEIKNDTPNEKIDLDLPILENPPQATKSNLSTLAKDSIESSHRELVEALNKEIDNLKGIIESKEEEAKKTATASNLVKSTYQCKRPEQVKEILYECYVAKLKELDKKGMSEVTLSESYKLFFTLEYCDNRVLQFIDELAGDRNRSAGIRLKVDYEKSLDKDLPTRKIVSFK